MEVFTVHEWEENFDDLFKRVEEGETIGIIDDDGNSYVMMPIDEDLKKLYTNHNEAP